MDLLQLEHFLAVVEEGTFTRGAERVCRSQPAISQSIKKLEESVGMPLFARGVHLHEVSLTEAGQMLADYARRILALRDAAMQQVAGLKALKSGTLSIAAHESAAVYLLSAPLHKYLQQFPDIKVGIYRSRLNEIPRQVMDREVDVGFVKDEPAFHELRWTEVHTDRMMVIAAPDHPLAGQGQLTVCDLADQAFVLHHLCASTAELLHQAFERNRTRLRVVADLWSFENLKTFVRQGVGLALVPGVAAREDLRAGVLVRLPVPELETPRRTLLVHREYLSETAAELVKLVRAFQWENETDTVVARPRLVAAARRARAARR